MRTAPAPFLALITLLGLSGAVPGGAQTAAGAVYVMTNARQGNEIVVFDRDAQGMLSLRETVSTGGRGSGGTIDPLGSQGAVSLSEDQRLLFAVNARSNQISVFEDPPGGLRRIGNFKSRGTFPISVSSRGELLYVLNALGRPGIHGFRIREDGTLKRLTRSRRFIESAVSGDGRAVHPVQVEISPDARWLAANDLDTDEIHLWALDETGRPSADAAVSPSVGGGPFGFTFARHRYLVVTELFGRMPRGTPDAGAVSSYAIEEDGSLVALSESASNFQSGTCWIVDDGKRFVFTTNTNSSTMSTYRVRKNGRLRRVGGGASVRFSGEPLALPIDLAATTDGKYIYTLNTGRGTVGMFRRAAGSGKLTALGEAAGLPAAAGLQGIAAR